MTNDELKEALVSGRPVIHGDIEYKCISAVIYRRRPSGQIYLEAELRDRRANSVSICDPAKVKFKED